MIVKSKWAALAGLCASTGVFAEHHGTEETRNHQAHVHGEVSFNIAQDGEDLMIAISAPGADIVGFEHAPENAQEEAVLKQALASLGAPEHLFVFNDAAQCQLIDHEIEQSLSDDHEEDHDEHDEDHEDDHDKHEEDHDEHEDDHDEHEEDHDEHEDDHDEHEEDHDEHEEDHDEHEEDHDEHEEDHDEHEEDHDEHDEDSHAAFEIAYQYQCHNASELTDIKTNWFKHFPNTQEIHVNLLTDQSQKVLELDAANSDIHL